MNKRIKNPDRRRGPEPLKMRLLDTLKIRDHKRPFLVAAVLLLAAAPLSAQMFGGGGVARGPNLPGTCSPGGMYYKTTASAGRAAGLYACTTANAWGYVAGGTAATTTKTSGCAMFPDSSIFHSRVDQLPRDDVRTKALLGYNWTITGASWTGGTATLTVTPDTTGLTVGSKVFVINANPVGYNTGVSCVVSGTTYSDTSGIGRITCDTDNRVTITALTSDTISYAVSSDPGAWVSGGHVSLGPYGGQQLTSGPSWALNIATESTPRYQLTMEDGTPFGAANDADPVLWPMDPAFYIESWTGLGNPPSNTLGVGPSESDAHVLTLDPATCLLYETYLQTVKAAPPYTARSGAMWDLTSNAMRTARLEPADPDLGLDTPDAAGLPLWPLTLKRSEVYGSDPIDHMTRMTLKVTAKGHEWPATHGVGQNHQTYYPYMGTVFRLGDWVDATGTCANGPNAGQPFSSAASKVLTGLKRYGIIVADIGASSFGFLSTSADLTSAENLDLAGWMKCVLMSDLEVVNTAAVKVATTSFDTRSITASSPTGKYYPVSFSTAPSGLTITVDGAGCVSPCQLQLEAGSRTIAASVQTSGGQQYSFASWSDGGAASHTISLSAPASFTATFTGQYITPADPTFSPSNGQISTGGTVTLATTPSSCNSYIYWNTTGGVTSGDTNGTSVVVASSETIYAKVIGCPDTINPDSGESSKAFETITNITAVGTPVDVGAANAVTFSGTSGDIAVVGVACTTSTATVASTTSGWTQAASRASATATPSTLFMFYKVLDSTGSTTFTANMNSCGTETLDVATYHGVDPSSPLDAVAAGNGGVSASGDAGSITTTTGTGMIVAHEVGRSGAMTPGVNYTQRIGFQGSASINRMLSDRLPAPSGAQTAAPFTLSPSSDWNGIAIALKRVP